MDQELAPSILPLENHAPPLTNDDACDALRPQSFSAGNGIEPYVFNFPPGELSHIGPITCYQSLSVRDIPSQELIAELKRRVAEAEKIRELLTQAELG